MNTKPLKDMRNDHDLKQQDVAKILKISRQYYCRYELGQIEMPLRHYVTLAKYYGVTLDYLTGFTPTFSQMQPTPLKDSEYALLNAFQKAPRHIQQAVQSLLQCEEPPL